MQPTIEKAIKSYSPKPIGEEKAYAVLLPLITIDNEWHVLYEVRSETISQPGEVSFPGGRIEAGESPQEAAVRETHEELNIPTEAITVLGEIDYLVQNHRTIHCFVGQLQIDCLSKITPNQDEVANIFTIPLHSLIEQPPTYYKLQSQFHIEDDFPIERLSNKGKTFRLNPQANKIPFYEQGSELLWGMTALFTHRFTEIIKDCGID